LNFSHIPNRIFHWEYVPGPEIFIRFLFVSTLMLIN
jgi:hypothetical protein